MIKVRVRKAGTGVAAASGLIALSGAQTGCVAEPIEPGDESIAEAEDELSPGTGTLALDGFPGNFNVKLVNANTDEFLRAGQALTIELPVWMLWDKLYAGTPLPNDLERLKQITATVTVSAVDKTTTIASLKAPVTTYAGMDSYGFKAITKTFIVPSKADWLGFAITITDLEPGGLSASITAAELSTLAVFGGELPNKSLFMDWAQATKRNRIIEGDDPIAGAELLLAVSDWRADVVVDKSLIDTQIGKAQSASRFGWVTIPIYGKIVHEVAYAVHFDDGLDWRPEVMLTEKPNSRFLGSGRTTYEGTIQVPAKARRMMLYMHVKTYLVADYTGYANITEKWYADGAKMLKADKYDNPNGAFTNYSFSIANSL
ncbi:hypothetical protein [Polyangium jinanense]|uniref:Uncharacterized protein n=1 Tax=Polyangium jinanense TaxID=2829994 RepID=A0A9X3WW29_9BACT|nr:hypothetical protein [Polyangium jinanense]MDC3953707.1 hypothetical protein [Polyangium jinanense]MDC3979172.1 hypothetical protein [Polyangium jinanense]